MPLIAYMDGPLARYVKSRVAHASGMPGTFSPPPWISDPDMHHDTCVTHVPWCMSGSLNSDVLWSRLRVKRSRHSRRMRNLQFYVSGKRPMEIVSAHAVSVMCPYNWKNYGAFFVWLSIGHNDNGWYIAQRIRKNMKEKRHFIWCIFLFLRHPSDNIKAFKNCRYTDMCRKVMTGLVPQNTHD